MRPIRASPYIVFIACQLLILVAWNRWNVEHVAQPVLADGDVETEPDNPLHTELDNPPVIVAAKDVVNHSASSSAQAMPPPLKRASHMPLRRAHQSLVCVIVRTYYGSRALSLLALTASMVRSAAEASVDLHIVYGSSARLKARRALTLSDPRRH